MQSHRLKAVIFDMDGVITDTMPYHYRCWKKVFTDHGIKISKFEIYRREGQKGIESIKEIFLLAGVTISSKTANQVIVDKEALFKKIVRTRYIPGAIPLIKKLHHSKIRLALVTGTADHEVRSFLDPAILALFDVIVTGTDVIRGKPDPEPYLKALELLEINGRDAIVIENAPFGIISAQSAGICCYAITTSLPAQYLEKADKTFKNHQEITTELFKRPS